MKKKTILRWMEITTWVCIGVFFGEIYMAIRLFPFFIDIFLQSCK